jgi:hypothetical protein
MMTDWRNRPAHPIAFKDQHWLSPLNMLNVRE